MDRSGATVDNALGRTPEVVAAATLSLAIIVAGPNVTALASEIETGLRAFANPERAASEKRYLKSDLEFLGTGVPALRRVTKAALRDYSDLTRADLLGLTEELWGNGLFELRPAAVHGLGFRNTLLEPRDVAAIEPLLRDAKTWALIDSLATTVLAPLVERHPELDSTLDRWAQDQGFWMRRAAMLALLPALRRGEGDFVRKAIGWVLREVSKKRPALVSAWLAPRTGRASGVTGRAAAKYLPDADRERLMAAYREHRPA